jgi:hypothetical protein
MRRQSFLAAVAVVGLIVALDGWQADTTERGIRLQFPDRADLTGLSIQYYLTGPFGGFGSFVRTSRDIREYVLETSYRGQQATTLKAIIYCPGYRIVLLDESQLDSSRFGTRSIEFKPLGQVPLSGRLISVPLSRGLSIEAVYLAHWGHDFFGIADGAVASFTVATSQVDADGSFSFQVPDFAHDPVVASFDEGPMRGELRLIPRESETGNIPYSLEEIQNAEREVHLPIGAEYPRDLLLVGVPR